jgi:hypothetical protein
MATLTSTIFQNERGIESHEGSTVTSNTTFM